jgi:hypothetical protein
MLKEEIPTVSKLYDPFTNFLRFRTGTQLFSKAVSRCSSHPSHCNEKNSASLLGEKVQYLSGIENMDIMIFLFQLLLHLSSSRNS